MAVTGWGEQGWDEDGFGGLISANVNVSGVSGSGLLGEEIPKTVQIAILTGLSAQGLVGIEDPDTNAEWGIGEWNQSQLGWGGASIDVEVLVSGLEAFGLLGDEEPPRADANVQVTSVTGTGEIDAGSVVQIQQNLNVTGFAATGTIGTAGSAIFAPVSVTGVEGTGEEGTVTEITGDTNVVVIGTTSTSAAGDVSISGGASASPTGVEGVGFLGEETTRGTAIVVEDGVSSTGAIGTATVGADSRVTVTGVTAVATIDNPLVWGGINTSQTPNWVEIDTNAA